MGDVSLRRIQSVSYYGHVFLWHLSRFALMFVIFLSLRSITNVKKSKQLGIHHSLIRGQWIGS